MLALCARILETVAKLEADLHTTKKVIEEFQGVAADTWSSDRHRPRP
jgi:hypothetical protein